MKIDAQHLKVAGKKMVMLSAAEYERLATKADIWEPPLPEPDADGNFSLEAVDVIIARGILRDRRKLGLTQAELARRAGIRLATLNRIEHGKIAHNGRVIDKIDRALKAAAKHKSDGKHTSRNGSK